MKKSVITTFAMAIYVIVFVIASSGAMNYAFDTKEHIYTVAGLLNLVFGGWSVYNAWKAENNKTTNKK